MPAFRGTCAYIPSTSVKTALVLPLLNSNIAKVVKPRQLIYLFIFLVFYVIFLFSSLLSIIKSVFSVKKKSDKRLLACMSPTKPFKITPILPKYSYYVHHVTAFESNQPKSSNSAFYQS